MQDMSLKTSECQARALDPTHRHCLRDALAVYRYRGQTGWWRWVFACDTGFRSGKMKVKKRVNMNHRDIIWQVWISLYISNCQFVKSSSLRISSHDPNPRVLPQLAAGGSLHDLLHVKRVPLQEAMVGRFGLDGWSTTWDSWLMWIIHA